MKLPKWRYAAVIAGAAITISLLAQNQTTPPWAYALNPPAPPGVPPAAAPADTSVKHVPGSNVALALPQTRDLFNPPDWYPDDHPAMPEVRHARPASGCPRLRTLPSSQRARPSRECQPRRSSAGYIVQQMADYKNGLRKTSESKMGPPTTICSPSARLPTMPR